LPARLTPLEDPTADALITGDPRRAFALAGDLTVQPKMSHQARGLWGYTGSTTGGMALTVQSTGIGGPSAVAVLGDLAGMGVRRIVRLGTCLAPAGDLAPGQAVLVERAIGLDGTSAALSDGERIHLPDPDLHELLRGTAPEVVVSSHDLVARRDPLGPSPERAAAVRDLQTAAIFAAGRRFEMKAAALLVVAGIDDGETLPEAELTELLIDVAREVVERLESRGSNPEVEG